VNIGDIKEIAEIIGILVAVAAFLKWLVSTGRFVGLAEEQNKSAVANVDASVKLVEANIRGILVPLQASIHSLEAKFDREVAQTRTLTLQNERRLAQTEGRVEVLEKVLNGRGCDTDA
jgi:hypothetical protein